MTVASTLVLLVTCSRDATRERMAIDVMKNLAVEIPKAGLDTSFIVFDNASTFRGHLDYLPEGARFIDCPNNIGYWSAIQHVLNIHPALFQRDFDFIYLIESDLVHHDLAALGECEEFLRATPEAACVRTQEFNVQQAWRYDKKLKFLPFHVARSEIHLIDLVTGSKAWFRKAKEFQHIYLSNLHAKLPALNRMDSMKKVFVQLSGQENFSEQDFFVEMRKLHPLIGLYNGGLFHSIFSRENKEDISGSYIDDKKMAEIGYFATRKSRIVPFPVAAAIKEA